MVVDDDYYQVGKYGILDEMAGPINGEVLLDIQYTSSIR